MSVQIPSVYVTDDDLKPQCPEWNCKSTNVRLIGDISIDGTEYPTHRCEQCCKIFYHEVGGIKTAVKELQQKYAKVSFVPSPVAVQETREKFDLVNHSKDTKLDSYSQSQLTSINSNLQTLSQMPFILTDIYQVMQGLSMKIERLTQQNVDLMEKIAFDPLNNIRKAVTSFDLE